METVAGLIPLLVYEDIEAAHDFLVKAFGFQPGGVERDPAARWSTVRSAGRPVSSGCTR
jgi:hypothetical protein